MLFLVQISSRPIVIYFLGLLLSMALTPKPFLGSLKTPEDKNPSYFFNRLNIFVVNFRYIFMVLKLVRSLGSLKTPKTVNVSIFVNGSKVKVVLYSRICLVFKFNGGTCGS